MDVLARIDPYWFAAAVQLVPEGESTLRQFHQDLQRYRELVQEGDTLAILQAMALCAERALPAPGWLTAAFVPRVRTFTDGGKAAPTSLDTVFRSPLLRPGKPALTHTDRSAWAEGYEIWRAVRRIAHQHRGLESALADVLAAGTWTRKRRRARQLVKMVDARMVHLNSGRLQPLAALWRKVCKPFPIQQRIVPIAQTAKRDTQHDDLTAWAAGGQHPRGECADGAEDRADGP